MKNSSILVDCTPHCGGSRPVRPRRPPRRTVLNMTHGKSGSVRLRRKAICLIVSAARTDFATQCAARYWEGTV